LSSLNTAGYNCW